MLVNSSYSTIFLALAAICTFASDSMSEPVALPSKGAGLRAFYYTYDVGPFAVSDSLNGNQHVICEQCPEVTPPTTIKSLPALRENPAYSKRHPVPAYKSVPYVPTEGVVEDESISEKRNGMFLAAHPATLSHRVLFQFNSKHITGEESRQLSKFLSTVEKDKDVGVRIEGHTCDIGTKKHNDKLSLDRAKAVSVFLRAKGFGASTLSGAGDSEPTGKGRKQDRRAEVIIGSKN